MSKQHPLDAREPRDLHTLLITDSGWSPYEDSEPGWSRDLSTTRSLSTDEKAQLLKYVSERTPQQGVRVVMQVSESGTDFSFYTRAPL